MSEVVSESRDFKLHRSYLISFILSNVGEIFCTSSEGPYLSLEKEKETFCVVFTNSVKRAREISKFHVAVCLKESEVWRKVISNKIIVTLVTQGLPSSFLPRPVA